MKLRYCPDCGVNEWNEHKDGCKYHPKNLLKSFDEAESRGDDLTCLELLAEKEKRNLKIQE